MEFKSITLEDLHHITKDYIHYFNKYEDSMWNEDTIKRKFKQLCLKEDYYGIGLYDQSQLIGFAVGNLIQFDDGLIAYLSELFIIKEYQNKGLGTKLLQEFERVSKALGAFRIQLESANDDIHHRFYNKQNSYQDATTQIFKSKAL